MRADEHNFVELIRRRREEGILYVIETYGGLFRSIVGKRLYSMPDRIDQCMNDIFFGIWKNIDSFDESRGSFVNWAAGVARLQAVDTLRKIQRELRLESVSLEDAEIPQDDRAFLTVEQEFSEETGEILKCLNERDRELFRRVFLEEQEPGEAGEALGISRDNVYVRIFRGKRKIRKKLQERKRA